MINQSTKYFVWGLLALLAWYYYRLATAAKNLGFTKGAMSEFKVSLKDGFITWIQGINVINGQSVGIPIRNAGILVSSGGTQVGYAILENPVTLSPGLTEMPLRIIIPLQNLLPLGFSVVEQFKAGNINARLSGTINSVGISYPLNQDFAFNWNKP
jgi:hypothetical protein